MWKYCTGERRQNKTMIKINKIITFGLILVSSIFLFNFFTTAESEDDKEQIPKKEGKKIYVPKDYKTIKEAIKVSELGDKIYVAPGNYDEPDGLNLKKGIEIYGSGAADTRIMLGSIGMTLFGDNKIRDLTFRMEKGQIYLFFADNVILQNCIIFGNGGSNNGLLIEKSENVKIINCTVMNLRCGIFIRYGPSEVLIKNSIISYNRRIGIFVSAETEGEGKSVDLFGKPIELPKKGGGEIKVVLEYNDVWGSFRNYYGLSTGKFDISEDPKFVGEGNYNLQSGSPCIDAGDPDKKYNDPDGTRNDLGALPYGRKR